MRGVFEKIMKWDPVISKGLVSLRTPKWVLFFKLISYSCNGLTWVVLALFLFLFHFTSWKGSISYSSWRAFHFSMLSGLLAWAVGIPIKTLFGRRRPFQKMTDTTAEVRVPVNDSFPSSHASSSMAFFICLLSLNFPGAGWVGVWSLLVSFSRLYLGVHYLSDILTGAVLGVIVGRLSAWILSIIIL